MTCKDGTLCHPNQILRQTTSNSYDHWPGMFTVGRNFPIKAGGRSSCGKVCNKCHQGQWRALLSKFLSNQPGQKQKMLLFIQLRNWDGNETHQAYRTMWGEHLRKGSGKPSWSSLGEYFTPKTSACRYNWMPRRVWWVKSNIFVRIWAAGKLSLICVRGSGADKYTGKREENTKGASRPATSFLRWRREDARWKFSHTTAYVKSKFWGDSDFYCMQLVPPVNLPPPVNLSPQSIKYSALIMHKIVSLSLSLSSQEDSQYNMLNPWTPSFW